MTQVSAQCADAVAMKAILSVLVYLVLVFSLGIVIAMTSRRSECEVPAPDEDI
jgi:hypothetical protein